MENFRFDVFLSHSSKDKSVVRPLAVASALRQKSGTFRFHDMLNRERRVLPLLLDDVPATSRFFRRIGLR